jgi:hypothetical protein
MEEIKDLLDIPILLKLSEYFNNNKQQKTFVICSTIICNRAFDDVLCRAGFKKTNVVQVIKPVQIPQPVIVQQPNIQPQQEEIVIEPRETVVPQNQVQQPQVVQPAPVNAQTPGIFATMFGWLKSKFS